MRPFLTLVVALALTLPFKGNLHAQASTDPVGFTTVSCLANSDTLLSVPFTRLPEFVGALQSVSGSTITVSGTPWTANQFVYAAGTQPKHYYVLIGPGTSNPKEGHIYQITGNTTNTLTVNTSQDSLAGTPANAQLLVIPNLTLGTVWPSTDQNVSFTPTTSTRTIKTEILIPDYAAVGVNQAFSAAYFFINSGSNIGWRKVGDADLSTPHNDDVLLPDGYFVVRNQNGAATGTLTSLGSVLTKKLAVPLVAQPSVAQDNAVAMVRPIDVKLSDTGLNSADGSFVATTSLRTIKDELLLFNNSSATLNKAPTTAYFYANISGNVGWRKVGDADLTTPHDNDLIPAGSAIIIRKSPTGTGQSSTAFWLNAPTY
ncbi:MAG: hypothetical protein QOH39_3103 [Verrucomicrobiota bacterium]